MDKYCNRILGTFRLFTKHLVTSSDSCNENPYYYNYYYSISQLAKNDAFKLISFVQFCTHDQKCFVVLTRHVFFAALRTFITIIKLLLTFCANYARTRHYMG